MRQDLLALTVDDLITLSNRGIVKRVQRELEQGRVTAAWATQEDGTLTAVWSDGVTCTFPPQTTLKEGQCTCPAFGICRHLVRSVLTYQTWAASQQPAVADTAVKPLVSPWNPGRISDDALTAHYRTAKLTRLRKQLREGHVFELVRSSKPTARIYTLACTVRFLVPDDIRYTVCDCAEEAPCSHVPLAIWAFRQLAPEKSSGIVETHVTPPPIPQPLLEKIEKNLMDLVELGFAGASPALIGRLRRLITQCQSAGLMWPAEILTELAQAHDRYTRHDARFSALHVAELMGELLIRCRVIQSGSTAVPAIFVRGSQNDQETPIGATRLMGLGCGVKVKKGSVTISAYLQNMDSGAVVAVQRDFADPQPGDGQEPAPFWQLGQTLILKDMSLQALGAKQLLVKGGKRSANHVFHPGRAKISVNPQAFNWDRLRAPTYAEDFMEIRARRAAQPPACLRPRHVGENLFVGKVAGVEQVFFDPLNQTVTAVVVDEADTQAYLVHPYTTRGQEGAETLLWWLHHRAQALRFISGYVHLGRRGLIINPLALIFEEAGGRQMIQPWIGRWQADQPIQADANSHLSHTTPINPIDIYPNQLLEAVSELYLTGLRRLNSQLIRHWQHLPAEGERLGFARLTEPVAALAHLLAQKQNVMQWQWQQAAHLLFDITVLARLAQEDIYHKS